MPPEPNDRVPGNRVPVSVITGFLGSGKTTLLNRLVRHPGMADAALIVNEFGEIGIDHALVDSSFENTVVMDSGCICCSIRGDLIDTVGDLFANVAQGRLPPFSRIVIETTGLADPVPIVQALIGEPVITERCRLDSLVTTVDAQNGARQMDEHEEAVRQAAVADIALITKTDLVPPDVVRSLAHRLARLNPGLPIHLVQHGEIDPALLFDGATRAVERIAAMGNDAPADEAHAHDHEHGHDHDHDHDQSMMRTRTAMATSAPIRSRPLSLCPGGGSDSGWRRYFRCAAPTSCGSRELSRWLARTGRSSSKASAIVSARRARSPGGPPVSAARASC